MFDSVTLPANALLKTEPLIALNITPKHCKPGSKKYFFLC